MAGFQLNGLASGLDTQSLISQLMSLERRPLAFLQMKQDRIQALKGAWSDISSRLDTLKSRVLDLRSDAVLKAKKADVSDQTVFTAIADSAAVAGVYNIVVSKLAQAHSVASGALNSTNQLGVSGTFTITAPQANGSSVTATITLDGTETLSVLRDKIAAAKDGSGNALNVSATIVKVDAANSRLVLTSPVAGANGGITIDGNLDNSDITNSNGLGFFTTANTNTNTLNTVVAAQNLEATINGVAIQRTSNTVKDAIAGVTLEFKSQSAKDAGGNLIATTLTVSDNRQKLIDAVKAMVAQYNSVVDFIGSKTGYDPKTKIAGDLSGDGAARQLSLELRRKATDSVSDAAGQYKTLSAIGISTGKYDSADKNKLVLDEAKLNQALDKDPAAVISLLTGADGKGGWVARLETYLNGYVGSGVISQKTKDYDAQIRNYTDAIRRFEDRLALRQANLERQFQALETVMSKLSTQQQYLSSQLAQLGGSQ